jgi:hypothetical protein
LVVLAIDGRPPIDVACGLTIALEVGADAVVVVVLDVPVVLTVCVGFATNSCELEVIAVACVKPPTFIPMEPTVDTDAGIDIDDVEVGFECAGKTGPFGLVGGDSDLAPNSTHSIR